MVQRRNIKDEEFHTTKHRELNKKIGKELKRDQRKKTLKEIQNIIENNKGFKVFQRTSATNLPNKLRRTTQQPATSNINDMREITEEYYGNLYRSKLPKPLTGDPREQWAPLRTYRNSAVMRYVRL